MEDRLLKGTGEFFTAYSDQPEMLRHLDRVLSSKPDFSPPKNLIPMDELEQRLSAIRAILDDQRVARLDNKWSFTRLQFATLVGMPLVHLQRPPNPTTLCQDLDRLSPLLNHFLQSKKFQDPEAETGTAAASRNPSKSHSKTDKSVTSKASSKRTRDGEQKKAEASTPAKAEDTVNRDKDERAECLRLDKDQCIVTKTGDPAVCHIIPFAWNSREGNREKTESFKSALATCLGLGSARPVTAALATLSIGLGKSDKTWNMLALSPTLHSWWGKGYFAFKWLGVLPIDPEKKHQQTVQLEFRWMPRSQVANRAQIIDFEEQNHSSTSLVGSLDHFYGPSQEHQCAPDCSRCTETSIRCIYLGQTGHPIRSGTIVTVTRDRASIESFKVMIDLQWGLIRAAAMSGAALAPELLIGPSDDDDDISPAPIESWRENVEKEAKRGLGTMDD
ncbi:hypothetical protein AK830_g12243 [Neonectria ditissima]|uniref:HNH nuclease domain-containing protein n=1 Tax=Neonectria ditissima TaxID=78410 RepID=A0A0P7B3Q5_9HYPO|nr:hypothetical protein AK830_g12243 [Neonectria ditissima]